jgi:hypothetical protein
MGLFEVTDEVYDCATTLLPCVHLLPEVWPGQIAEYTNLSRSKQIEAPGGNGVLGRAGLHVSKFTLQQYPSLAIWLGYAGGVNRRLLATLFKRPTTWSHYCNILSPCNCSVADGTAARYPEAKEESMYFSEVLRRLVYWLFSLYSE